ncbi:MAG: GNAT family N-acetyltransferase [Betaproteobacteria bacterium]
MTIPAFDWRRAALADVPALATLYRAAALALGPQVYTPEQVAAWASFAVDAAGFERYVLGPETWLAECEGRVVGFCGIERDERAERVGEVRSLYILPGHMRQGMGTELLARSLARAEADGVARFAAWVTPFSRPVFEAAGFVLVRTVAEPFEGTQFERYRVERG